MRLPVLSIRRKLLLIISAVVLTAVLSSYLMFTFYRAQNDSLLYQVFVELLHQVAARVESALKRIENDSVLIMADPTVQQRLQEVVREGDPYLRSLARDALVERLVYSSTPPIVPVIHAVDIRGEVYSGRDDFPAAAWRQPEAGLDAFLASGASTAWIATREDQRLIYLLRRVRKVAGMSLETLGTVIVGVDKQRLIEDTVDLNHWPQPALSILDQNGVTIYDDRRDGRESPPLGDLSGAQEGFLLLGSGERKEFVVFIESPYLQWKFICRIPYHKLFHEFEMLHRLYLALNGLLILGLAGLNFIIARSVSRPIINLAASLKTLEAGHFEVGTFRLPGYHGRDEIGILYEETALMLGKIKTLINENYRKQILLRETEFKALQTQINPHFLYNTLESINLLALMNNQERISSMVKALGDLLRSGVNPSRHIISIGEEIELLRKYILIQKTRFEDRLSCELNIEPTVRDWAVPRLLLQPLVENSIKYSVETREKPVHVQVLARKDGNTVILDVVDNGPGMDYGVIEPLLAGRAYGRPGIGLANIRDRLKQLFGVHHSFRICSSPEAGTRVTIQIPKQRPEDFDDL